MINDPLLALAKTLSKQGMNVEQIAASTGLSVMAVKGATVSKKRIWTNAETRELKRLAGTVVTADIAKAVNKTVRQVQHKAQSLGLSLAFKNDKPKPWTSNDERFLKKNAGELSGVEIAKQLGRKPEHVYRKAYLLGLSLYVRGENSHAAIYSNSDIELCRQLADEGLKAPTIANKMEMSRSFVHQLIKHERRAYV